MPNYTNSSLVSHTRWSPNHNDSRVHPVYNPKGTIDGITIHHVSGNCSIETLGEIFVNPARQASSNYGIGSDGRIGLYVSEKYRPWTSGSASNDYRMVTIEVANSTGAPDWKVSDKAYASLINLCTDICKRNGIKKLNYTGSISGNLTMHCWFQATDCPGPYLKSKFVDIANKVNANLGAVESIKPTTSVAVPSTSFSKNDKVTINSGAVYYGTTSKVPEWVLKKSWIIKSISGDRAVLDKSTDGTNSINSPISTKYLKKVTSTTPAKPVTPTTSTTSKTPTQTGLITYQSYANNKWLGEIKSTTGKGTDAYSGIIGKPLSGVRAKAENGKIYIQSHILGGNWLGIISEYSKSSTNGNTYSGIMGQSIDAIKVWSDYGFVEYRVHIKGGDWLSWIDSRNHNNNDFNSYAGIYGKQIDAIQMR